MKCGSTTLFRDLDASPLVSFPAQKEPHNLIDDGVLSGLGKADYAKLYKHAKPDQLLGDASTGYTKLPTHTGVPQRAKAVLGESIKLIYIIRNPIKRIESHYRHLQSHPDAKPASLEEILQSFPEVIDYSCYGQQLNAWRDVFPEEQFHVMSLEKHEESRQSSTNKVCEHLGIPHCGHLAKSKTRWNSSSSKPIARGTLASIITSPLYINNVQPLLSRGIRDLARRILLPKAKPVSAVWTESAWELARVRLEADAALLASLTNGQFGLDTTWLKQPFLPLR